jgi:hypothetical protein
VAATNYVILLPTLSAHVHNIHALPLSHATVLSEREEQHIAGISHFLQIVAGN